MHGSRLDSRLMLSAFAAALLIGTAPAAWAQCEGPVDSAQAEIAVDAAAGGAENGAQTGATAAANGQIETDQGGTTTDETGQMTAQTGGAEGEAGAAAAPGQTATVDTSPEIQGPDEEQVASLLEQQGYTDVASIYSCGYYYEAVATKDGQEETVHVDLDTATVAPAPEQSQQQQQDQSQ